MDRTRRKLLAGIAACAAGVTNAASAANAMTKPAVLDYKMATNRKKGQRQGKPLSKEDLQLKYDLTFPYQHLRTSYKDRLKLIDEYMDATGLTEERYCKGKAISKLEEKLAALFGKPAAMWCPTGTLAQGIATRIHGKNTGRNKLQMHPTSHLVLHEEGGYEHAHDFEAIISGEWRQPMSADLIDSSAACMIIEMPQRHSGGMLPEWHELEKIKRKARSANVPLHMDGARIWSSRTFYNNRTYAEIADGFSSIYVSFYKDIGACGGAALIGDEAFIEEARVWRTRLGGLVSEHWPVVCDTLRLIDTKLLQVEDNIRIAREYASFINETSAYSTYPNQPQSNLFHVLLPCTAEVAKAAHLEAASETGIWLTNAFWNYENPNECAMEITISEKAASVPKETLEKAFSAFLNRL